MTTSGGMRGGVTVILFACAALTALHARADVFYDFDDGLLSSELLAIGYLDSAAVEESTTAAATVSDGYLTITDSELLTPAAGGTRIGAVYHSAVILMIAALGAWIVVWQQRRGFDRT